MSLDEQRQKYPKSQMKCQLRWRRESWNLQILKLKPKLGNSLISGLKVPTFLSGLSGNIYFVQSKYIQIPIFSDSK